MESANEKDQPSTSSKLLGMFSHFLTLSIYLIPVPAINFLCPFFIYLFKRQDPFVFDQAKESLNFQLTLLMYAIIGFIIAQIISSDLALFAVGVFGILFTLIASIKSFRGNYYRYPLTIRLLR